MAVVRRLRNLWHWLSFPRRHRIPPDALVVDVGSGGSPNWRANVLVDKFLADDAERGYRLAIDERPFMVCDARYLPFRPKTVDYIICSHLAEHMEDPEALFAELSRVAKAGYVECPGRIHEMLHGWDYHRWYVDVRDGRLMLEEKPRPLHDPEMHAWFSHFFTTDRQFERFFLDRLERLEMGAAYEWVDEIEYVVRRSDHSVWPRASASLTAQSPLSPTELDAQVERVRGSAAGTRNERIKRLLGSGLRRRTDARAKRQLRAMLCCPICKGDLDEAADGLTCGPCAAHFPVAGNVHYLVAEQVARSRDALAAQR